MQLDKDLRSIQEVRDLLSEAGKAQRALAAMSQAQLDAITAALSRAGAEHARRLGAMAAEILEYYFSAADTQGSINPEGSLIR